MVKLRHLQQTNQFLCFCLSEVSTEDVMKKLEKRNNETTVSDARARYLQRKQQKQQSKALWQKVLAFEDIYHAMYHKGAFGGTCIWIINICYIYNNACLLFNSSTLVWALGFMGLWHGSHLKKTGALYLNSEQVEREQLA